MSLSFFLLLNMIAYKDPLWYAIQVYEDVKIVDRGENTEKEMENEEHGVMDHSLESNGSSDLSNQIIIVIFHSYMKYEMYKKTHHGDICSSNPSLHLINTHYDGE